MPQVSFILVANPQGEYQPYTLLHHNAHFNISSLLNEENQRDFNSDTALLVAGFIGDYPQAIWHITEDQQAEFVAAVSAINTEMDYQAVKAKFGIRRTHPDFWHYSDLLHQVSQKFNGVEYGLFDYNRLENR